MSTTDKSMSTAAEQPGEVKQEAAKQEASKQEYKGRYAAFINAMTDKTAKNYLVERIVPQMDYYSKNSAKNRKLYYRFAVISIILNAVIPIIVLFDHFTAIQFWLKVAIASVSAAAGVLTAVSVLKNYRELWIEYRVTLEKLKCALDSYFLKSGEFFGKSDDDECTALLEAVCSSIMGNEHELWRQMHTAEKKEK
ncbi:MAG: DUF4231 domain-containing protein [Clostridia bacterium]|nr:DUF4231 domain-containing protein [Clostridia bacterium]